MYEPVHNMNCKEVAVMPTEKPRYTIIVDDELLKRIDDFRFENRYPSRSAATLELIRLGMEAFERKQAKAKVSNPTPKDGGSQKP